MISGEVALVPHYTRGRYTNGAQAMIREISSVHFVGKSSGGLGIGKPYSFARLAANLR
jgi:hypothetical protein